MIGLAFADLILFESRGDDSRLAIPLRDGEEQVGTLVVPANLSRRQQERVHRMTPSLEALVVATRDRLKINAEVSALGMRQAALRRVATLVARGAAPDDIYPVAVAELANGPDVEHATLIQYDGHDGVVLAIRDTLTSRPTTVVGRTVSARWPGYRRQRRPHVWVNASRELQRRRSNRTAHTGARAALGGGRAGRGRRSSTR